MPDCPARSARQNASFPKPIEETTPRPVITTVGVDIPLTPSLYNRKIRRRSSVRMSGYELLQFLSDDITLPIHCDDVVAVVEQNELFFETHSGANSWGYKQPEVAPVEPDVLCRRESRRNERRHSEAAVETTRSPYLVEPWFAARSSHRRKKWAKKLRYRRAGRALKLSELGARRRSNPPQRHGYNAFLKKITVSRRALPNLAHSSATGLEPWRSGPEVSGDIRHIRFAIIFDRHISSPPACL